MKNIISEIDLVMVKSKTLIVVEVKFRTTFEDGLNAVLPYQQQKIRRAFALYASQFKENLYDTLRCDIRIVTPKGRIHHIKNAF